MFKFYSVYIYQLLYISGKRYLANPWNLNFNLLKFNDFNCVHTCKQCVDISVKIVFTRTTKGSYKENVHNRWICNANQTILALVAISLICMHIQYRLHSTTFIYLFIKALQHKC